jgi:putative DNA methylase
VRDLDTESFSEAQPRRSTEYEEHAVNVLQLALHVHAFGVAVGVLPRAHDAADNIARKARCPLLPGVDLSESEAPEEEDSGKKLSGLVMEYDAARKIAQGLGVHLERLSSLVEISGDKARLLPVSERARHLFGRNEATAPTKLRGKPKQLSLLDILGATNEQDASRDEGLSSRLGISVLDRIHQSMLLFGVGRGEALKRFLVNDGVGQDQRFWRLAQALSALYPKGTDERRWSRG